eukprot:TRINITY_DN71110_c0_g1_i1.p1 TRINITY_DN71110_c0_g1~~TRINITY_DN71110_c0_g1_i1.p1  ORF type:complete len:210 (-),score=16.40 TRINITY_DN71110_c0_g1_i1:277-906(-)
MGQASRSRLQRSWLQRQRRLAATAVTTVGFHLIAPCADAGLPCSNLDEYARWLISWTDTCRPDTSNQSSFDGWFGSCDWVVCKCLGGMALTPVPANELVPCFQEALTLDKLTQDSKMMITAMMRTCGAHAAEKSRPCGECDKYRDIRECDALVSLPPEPLETALVQTPAPGPPAHWFGPTGGAQLRWLSSRWSIALAAILAVAASAIAC